MLALSAFISDRPFPKGDKTAPFDRVIEQNATDLIAEGRQGMDERPRGPRLRRASISFSFASLMQARSGASQSSASPTEDRADAIALAAHMN
jgi:hypothetical protein